MKAIARSIRQKLVDHLGPHFAEGQGGAKTGSSMSKAQTLIRGHIRRLHQEMASGAAVFIDGISAFYATVREYLFDSASNFDDSERIVKLIELLHPSEETRAKMMSFLYGPSVLQECQVPDAIRRFVMATLTLTGFSMDGKSDLSYQSQCGTCPGAPLADILFQAVFLRSLRELRVMLRASGAQATIEDPVTCEMHAACSPTWVDDVAIVVSVLQPMHLIENVTVVVQHGYAALELVGVKTNFSPGKTEILAVFNGPGSRAQRAKWLSDDKPVVPVQLPDGSFVEVLLAESYLHLGNLVHHRGSDLFDIKRRRMLSQIVFKPLKAKLLNNPHLTLAEKKILVHSLVETKLLAGAGAWALRSDAELKAYVAGYHGHWRQCCKPMLGVTSAGLVDEQVCTLLGVATAHEVIRVARVRFLLQTLREVTPYLLSMLARDTWWTPLVAGDVCAVGCHLKLEGLQHVPHGALEMHKFLIRVIQYCEPIYKAAKSYLKRCVQSREWQHDEILKLVLLKTQIRKANVADCTLKDLLVGDQHVCTDCGLMFATRAAMGSNRQKVHHKPSEITAIARGSLCQVCLKDFHTTSRSRKHLRSVQTCRMALSHSDTGGDGPVIKGSERAWLVPRTVNGPRNFWAQLRVSDDGVTEPCGGMNPAGIGERLLAYCCPGQFRPAKAVQIFMAVHKLMSCFGSLDYVKDYLEGVPIHSGAVCTVLHVIEACERVSIPRDAFVRASGALCGERLVCSSLRMVLQSGRSG